MANNPLLNPALLPPFSRIENKDIEEAVTHFIDQAKQQADLVCQQADEPSWDNLLAPLEQAEDELEQLWSAVSHLNGVQNTEELRQVYNACLPKLSAYGTQMGQNEALFKRYSDLKKSAGFEQLNQAQQKVIDNSLRDFKLSGIDLSDADKKRYGQISQRLSELSSKYSENVLDSTHGWSYHCQDVEQLAGIPESALSLYQQAAQAKELVGYLISLDIPSYLPVMQYAQSRQLRQDLYRAYVSRASELSLSNDGAQGQWDNSEIMVEILQLKQEKAKLLGFENYAQLSIATKMADKTDDVLGFLYELADKSSAIAKQEYQDLQDFATEQLGIDELQAWDIAYASEKLRLHQYNVSQEELKPYFPAEKVIQGMFSVVEKLFGLSISQQLEFDSYHDDVGFYQISLEQQPIAYFYLDIFARQGKRGGAWMADCRVRRRLSDQQLQLPVAFLTCNFTPPTADLPSLLSHNEVTTLFHEFGHGLHHMLTQVEVAGVSGISGVEWDAVELPSQFLENWCWQESVIGMISSHHETAEVLPKDLLDKLLAAKNFQSGMQMLRQIEFALFDFQLHSDTQVETSQQIKQQLQQVREKIALYSVPSFNRFENSFSHIFAGGYAAGYYSYKWAEVLSADAFSAFEESDIFSLQTGQAFLSQILQQGGSQSAMQLFKNFRGRAPKVDALLRHSGLSA